MANHFVAPFVVLVEIGALAGGCNSGHSSPIAPSSTLQSTTNPTVSKPPQPAPNPEATRAYLDGLLNTMQSHSINKDTIDWATFRAQVLATAANAQTIPDLYPAIETALRLLDDRESYYQVSSGGVIGPPPVGGCAIGAPVAVNPPSTVGYVKVGNCDCQGRAADQFAESIQDAIRRADNAGIVGWIVDLRGNFGGNMWPMIAGVGPVLGEGIIGWIQYNDREYEREYRDGAAMSFGDIFARVATPYRLLKEDPKVAVLTDGSVQSAGEGVAIFFKGRADTRSFGAPTCGHQHLQLPYSFDDGTLQLVTSQHADRLKRRYAGSIAPDEIVADPVEAVRRAVAWVVDGVAK
jgi:Peptidase family S41